MTSPAPSRRQCIGALDACAFTIPVSLGATTLVFSHVGLGYLPAGVLALLVSLALTHLFATGHPRPVVQGARLLEATALAEMMDQVIRQLPGWGLPATADVRLAMLCLIVASAGWVVGLLYIVRADRFTRFIPAPVFAGFANSLALALLLMQWHTISTLLDSPWPAPVLSIAALVLVIALALHHWLPKWPGMTMALTVGLLMGVLWPLAGQGTPTIGGFGWVTQLPVMLANFGALAQPGVQVWAVAGTVATCAGVLGTLMFINTTMASQLQAQRDVPRPVRRRDVLWPVLGATLGGALGSVPVSGSSNATAIAARHGPITRLTMFFCALSAVLIYCTGLIGMIPLAAVSGALLAEAWLRADRPSVRMFVDWALRRPMTANARVDLAVIIAMMAATALFGILGSVLVGLLFGLLRFAKRPRQSPR